MIQLLSQKHVSEFNFFLGGHDAEMITIREILTKQKNEFYDKGLHWGAKLSDYNNELKALSKKQIPVFIELKIDIQHPNNSIIIDHHGPKAGIDLKTSLEQVAELLDQRLTRQQQLIAANDRGYIPAMQSLGASTVEIEEIRQFDRQCQGVTEEDETAAEQSVSGRLLSLNSNTVLVDALTEKNSPIIDRIWRENLNIFIQTPSGETDFYGAGSIIRKLEQFYTKKRQILPDLEYWGGGELPKRGFFGAKQGLTRKTIEEAILERRMFSQHIFMFPFRLENVEKLIDLEMRRNQIEHCPTENPEGRWRYQNFEICGDKNLGTAKQEEVDACIWAYNEFAYFHDFVRRALYTRMDESDHAGAGEPPNPVSIYFEKPMDGVNKAVYHLAGKDKEPPRTYELEIDHIALRIFEFGVGILTIELLNYCYPDVKDVLKINDFGRRIYPQYLGARAPFKNALQKPEGDFFCSQIEFFIDGKSIDGCKPFKTEDFLSPTLDKSRKIQMAGYLQKLLGPAFSKAPSPNSGNHSLLEYTLLIDDRMFVVCWYGNDKWAKEICTPRHGYCSDKNWYQYVYVDGTEICVHDPRMQQRLVKESTYTRWLNYNTLYGISRYSLVCLTENSGFMSYHVIRNHMQKMYYQMAVLLLGQRASVLKFLDEVANIGRKLRDFFPQKNVRSKPAEHIEKIVDEVRELHAAVIRFNNSLWFKEVTPQEQGIEMFDMAQKTMRLPEMVDDLNGKIKELYEFVDLANERQSTKAIKTLTIVGSIFLPLSLAAGIWGMNIYFMKYLQDGASETVFNSTGRFGHSLVLFLLSIIFMIQFAGSLKDNSKHYDPNLKSFWWIVFAALIQPFTTLLLLVILGWVLSIHPVFREMKWGILALLSVPWLVGALAFYGLKIRKMKEQKQAKISMAEKIQTRAWGLFFDVENRGMLIYIAIVFSIGIWLWLKGGSTVEDVAQLIRRKLWPF